ncbi:Apoptosis-inducing factor 3 [Frankliniella fusca]|uniref:Apoptosis-inducing factor 3 n=1 Tax=Frankliniella fusca TaxID=407009 RepID=A0AAE1HW33_9NEOP|nr:Apoptosis-inducing factor 3 [Frankliniella fusca]
MACSTMGSGHSRGKLEINPRGSKRPDDGGPGSTASSDYVEDYVCNESDLQENEMKAFDMPDDSGKVLVIKQKGKITAIGSKCTHYGAPLVKGVLGDGHVRCPWHGACFNVTTGDIEDFPGLDSLPCFDVSVEDGRVKVKAHKDALKSSKTVKAMTSPCGKDSRTFVVIGAGAAGACAVETLRQEGFSGKIIMVTSEQALPYDRIKLSKMLDADITKLQLRQESFYKDHGIEILTGKVVSSVKTTEKKVCLEDGSEINYSRLLVASGSQANAASQPGSDLKNIFSLRTISDANTIFHALHKESNVVIVGASFIGMEAAAYCVPKVKSVTVVGRGTVPFQPILGEEVGARIKQLFDEKGVKFCLGLDVSSFEGDESVNGVKLSNDQVLPADIVILGIGAHPSTSFLQDSGIDMNRGAIVVNKFMESSIPDVFVAGDAAYAPVFASNDRPASIGHWQLAHYHGRIAARNMLGKQTELKSVPFFWTMLFGVGVRYAGFGAGFDDIVITGDLAAMSFIAHYCVGNEVVAVATVGSDPAAAKFAEMLGMKKTLSKEDVKSNGTEIRGPDKILQLSEYGLLRIGSLGPGEVKWLSNNAAENLLKKGFMTSLEFEGLESSWRRLSTGCQVIDNILCGGFSTRGITELCGESGCGKTQLCLQLCLSVQYPISHGGLGGGAVFICTEDSFPAKRLKQLFDTYPRKRMSASLFQDKVPKFGDSIFIEHVADAGTMRQCVLGRLPRLLSQQTIKLIVVDSVAGVFRSCYENNEMKHRAEDMRTVGGQLLKLASQYKLCIICVNQVTASDGPERCVPALGLAWSNMVTSRIQMHRVELGGVDTRPHRSLEIIFAPDLQQTSVSYTISESGVFGIARGVV